jgi:hypothetical protein
MSFPFIEPGLRAALAERFPRRDGGTTGVASREPSVMNRRPLRWFGEFPSICPTRVVTVEPAAVATADPQ